MRDKQGVLSLQIHAYVFFSRTFLQYAYVSPPALLNYIAWVDNKEEKSVKDDEILYLNIILVSLSRHRQLKRSL
jgi:hypothetical protein